MRVWWVGCLCLGVLSPAVAEDDFDLTGLMRPGLWETETRQVSSNGKLGPVETDQQCVTVDAIEDFSSFTRGPDSGNVEVQEFERGDDYLRYRIAFTGDDPQAEAAGSMTAQMEFDGPERYQGEMSFEMKFGGQTMEQRSKISARRIGECSAEDSGD